MKRTFIESYQFKVESKDVVEEGGKRLLKLTGVFQKGNSVNKNKRVYSTELLTREAGRFQKKIKEGTAMGKAYHPSFWDFGGSGGATDISHRVTELHMEGDLLLGELVVFETNSGKDITAIVDGGGTVSISSRGYGSSKREKWPKDTKGAKEVSIIQDDYVLEAFDIVTNPSVTIAKLHVTEAVERILNGESVKDVIGEAAVMGASNLFNKNNKGEDTIMKSVAELKESYPAIHDQVYTIAETKGKELGKKEAQKETENRMKLENETAIGVIKTEHEAAVVVLNKENSDKIKVLETENADLKKKMEATESAKLATDIKSAVTKKISDSNFKDCYGEDEIAAMCSVTTVEDAEKAFDKLEALMVKVSGASGDNSGKGKIKNPDTNEDDTSGSDAFSKEGIAEMRRSAGIDG